MGTYYPNHNYGPEHAASIGAAPKRQISEKQLEANRSNALRSTGPRTAEGKARASRNAYRHGLTGQVSVNTDEDRVAHEAFTAEIITGLKPEGAIEKQLALSIAEQYWRLNRARSIEDNVFALGNYGPAGDIDVDHAELHTALTSARVFLESSKVFERLTLYEQRIHRTLEKDTAKLEALQAQRKAERDAALEEAAILAKVADHYDEEIPARTEVNGFIFSTDEVEARVTRNRNLKRFAFHERNHWIPTIEYPAAA